MRLKRNKDGTIAPATSHSHDEYVNLLMERIRKKSKKTKVGCIEWQGAKERRGYGQIRLRNPRNRLMLVHRLVWTLTYGQEPIGLDVCHKCDNPCCINIDHLFVGTRADNMADMVKKGRGGDTKGAKSGMAKLSENDVIEMRRMADSGRSQSEIASTFSVYSSTVSRILSGKRWPHMVGIIQ